MPTSRYLLPLFVIIIALSGYSLVLHLETLPALTLLAGVVGILLLFLRPSADSRMGSQVCESQELFEKRQYKTIVASEPEGSPLGELARTFLTSARNRTNTISTISLFADQIVKESDQVTEGAVTTTQTMERVQHATEEFNQGMRTIDQVTQGAADNVTSMAAAMDEMNATVTEIAQVMERIRSMTDNATSTTQGVAERMHNVDGQAADSVTGINNVNAAITEVKSRAEQLETDMAGLEKHTEDIGKIMTVITDIADQTNLLALNAAIEAARAGEAGRGFAVVADEVRKLAEKTMLATRDVGETIRQIQDMSHRSVQATNSALEAIDQSTETANQQIETIEALRRESAATTADVNDIAVAMSEIHDLVFNAASASEEQSQTTNELAGNISSLSEGFGTVVENVHTGFDAAIKIGQDIAEATRALHDSANQSLQMNSAARELAEQTTTLTKEVEGCETGSPIFNVGKVKVMHLAWRARLESAIRGFSDMRADQVVDHHNCDFGKWYDVDGLASFRGDPLFQEVGREHEQVHTYARRIIGAVNQGRKDEARALLGEFEQVRTRLFAALDKLYLESYAQEK